MVIFAFSWKRSEEFTSDLLSPIISPILSPIKSFVIRRAGELMCYLLELTEPSNQNQDGDGVSKTVPVRTGGSFQGPSRRSAMSVGALQVRRRSNDVVEDVEKGQSGGSDPTNQSNDHES